ncbi:MAG: DUF6444 domain-containing protein [Prevotella sp.]|nr:DUF6444 domain-containing protein [Prevotella sp.]
MKKGILKNQEKGLSKPDPKSVTTAKSVVTDAEFVQQAILSRLSTLETKVKDLSSDNSRKERHIQSLQKQLHDVKQENKKLKNENNRLRSQVEKLSGGSTPTLNSQNSSTPPSKDTITNSQARARRTSSLREKSDRHIGGQPGHKGAKIKMKVSQCFRSFKGAEAFDVLHSLMDTAKKNGQSAFNVIRAIAYPKAIADGVYLQF